LLGGYRLTDSYPDPSAPTVQLAVAGTLVPEALEAAAYLRREGVAANVLNLTSPRRLYTAWRAGNSLDWLIPTAERHAPIVTIHDAASHSLAWLGGVHGARLTSLGVDTFGQSGGRDDLYNAFGLDALSIVEAAFAATDV
jgi:pyruvate dehydrogenase E1 component